MSIAQRIHALLEQDPSAHPSTLATQLAVSEWEVVRHLPAELMTQVPSDQAEVLLAELAGWGPVTTIVESDGSIFEVKAPFPKGKTARGYYNLMGRDGELHGHLRLDNVVGIALVSKLFMGKEGHSFQFFGHSGRCIFKIYLGRDEQRQLLPEQVERFMALRRQYQEEVKA
ncbi:heme utilization cystosolic carrier protein HutX [Aeromonas caviae]|uniref:heme utilization cystosolic carrier protein HutX n=1 Tax=Aeromonas caviae TaxID=648 RepID=UPI00191F2209|nr:heme utilization cystosolic carrier protein HutX [Aeromonas caviae]MBL0606729.1 heme utilization cystosolic carrier protein HutX [Aeromonas caviae]